MIKVETNTIGDFIEVMKIETNLVGDFMVHGDFLYFFLVFQDIRVRPLGSYRYRILSFKFMLFDEMKIFDKTDGDKDVSG